ncbi:hypothetical protein Tco_1050517 [Tanacetum coccineum]
MKQRFLGPRGKAGGCKIDKPKDNRASSSTVVKTKGVHVDGLGVFPTRNDNPTENPISELQIILNVLDSATGKLITTPIAHVSYENLLNGESSRKSVNFRTLLASAGNGAYVTISMESVRVVHERLSNVVYGFFLGKHVVYLVVENHVKNTWSKYGLNKSMMTIKDSYTSTMCTDSWGRSSYAKSMVELRADVELKDTLMVVVSKCVDVLKNLKNPRQAVRGV